MSSAVTATVLNVRLIVDSAVRAGVSESALLAAADVPADALDDEHGRLEYGVLKRLWSAASELTGDDFFGLHAGEDLRLTSFGLIGFAVRSCRDGAEAIDRGIGYARRFFDDTEVDLVLDGPLARFRHRFGRPDATSEHATDFIHAAFVTLSREFTGADWEPVEVSFARQRPRDVSEYERLFRGPLRFDTEWSSISFDRDLLKLRLVRADEELLALLEQLIEDFLERVPRTPELTARAHSVLARAVQGGDSSLEATAKSLDLTPRTLQRRLREEGSSHRELLDAVRSDFARRYLLGTELSIDQIAYLLGFSEPSAFHRAFRRWTGAAPMAFREGARRQFEAREAGSH